MNILFLTQYYPPEVGAPQNRISGLVSELKKAGHKITVLTAMPNYPKGEIFDGYKGKIVKREEADGITVVRTWIYATPKSNFIARLLNYFSFTITSVIFGLWMVGKQDVIITESPPLFLGISGYVISKFKRAAFVFNVSDLWPESAIKLGILRNGVLIKLSEWLEAFCYNKAALITGQTQGIVNDIVNRGWDGRKVYLITNGIDDARFESVKRDNELRRQWGIGQRFAVCYAGIHGHAQGLQTIIEAAWMLKEHDDIVFVFVGEGPEKNQLIDMAKSYNLSNVIFMPMQPRDKMPSVWASMDAAIIPLKALELFAGALPSKMFEAMAASLPIVLSVKGEAQQLIEQADAGLCVEPENAAQIAEAVLKLSGDRELCRRLGQNGACYVREHYSRKVIAQKLDRLLQAVVEQNTCSSLGG